MNHEPEFGSWCDFTTLEKSVEYDGLHLGEYTFHVKAKTRANQVSTEAVRSFSVTSGGIAPKEMVSFTVISSSASVNQGDALKLTATVLYSDGTSEDVSNRTECRWTSKNPSIAAVDASGSVRGVAQGTAEITVSYSGYEASASIEVLPGGR
ncbi:MAG: Ig-like domain-containing protein [Thermodesulfobacteriota bacterium]|nr:Ig-like domain-containing protein [Thermodesulfobacteriota bacterium]